MQQGAQKLNQIFSRGTLWCKTSYICLFFICIKHTFFKINVVTDGYSSRQFCHSLAGYHLGDLLSKIRLALFYISLIDNYLKKSSFWTTREACDTEK